jgi:hypothetical protein
MDLDSGVKATIIDLIARLLVATSGLAEGKAIALALLLIGLWHWEYKRRRKRNDTKTLQRNGTPVERTEARAALGR